MILTATLTMVGLGAFFAIVLAIASQKLKVTEDPKIEELSEALPRLNCGACGFPSCHEFAKAVVEGKDIDTTCRVGGESAAEAISKITGVRKTAAKKIAVVFCGAREGDKTKKAVYKGVATCRSSNIISTGAMNCAYGCLGFGDCMRACPFGAIVMEDGLPKIDPEKCVACGKCVSACPRGIIELLPFDTDNLVVAACRSRDPGSVVRKNCRVGCIACKICERLSGGVFYVEDNHSKLKTERMEEKVDWDQIIKKCPTKTIVKIK
ncbi:MAG: RnfABCDGE type electron transport complex subunit B [Candidatus Omnitrophica bacterium]|nr:RnfABCDGE type electron transport complex subunit B [Candidatus Omnitrophota bacterium]